ncbi:MAG: plastocyanin/azurin family copper-binding protein [Actinomycetota bacterium]|nr:plastocyanin/azurin family copper-binding protein [Actinomycetota bacterium]
MRWLAIGIAACGVMAYAAYASAGPDPSRTIEIAINHSAFDVTRLEIDGGDTVRFVLRNDDPIDHEFIVGDRTVQDVHEEGTEAHHDERPTEVTIPAGETVETTITFDAPLSSADPLLFGCHLPGHYDYGMKGVIELT